MRIVIVNTENDPQPTQKMLQNTQELELAQPLSAEHALCMWELKEEGHYCRNWRWK